MSQPEPSPISSILYLLKLNQRLEASRRVKRRPFSIVSISPSKLLPDFLRWVDIQFNTLISNLVGFAIDTFPMEEAFDILILG
jgi:hypothetical protein